MSKQTKGTKSTKAARQPSAAADEVPTNGKDRRAWIRFQLQRRENPETGERYTQADVAREAFMTESTVSRVYIGDRRVGPGSEKVMRITARILGMTTDRLFGVTLEPGDGYTGKP